MDDDRQSIDWQLQFLIDRLMNYNPAGGGTNLPPQVRGNSRVSMPAGFQVLALETTAAGNKVSLTWNEPDDPYYAKQIDTYNIYAQRGDDPTALVISSKPPCVFVLSMTGTTQNVKFTCQPVLRNGYRPPLEVCPTCTSVVS